MKTRNFPAKKQVRRDRAMKRFLNLLGRRTGDAAAEIDKVMDNTAAHYVANARAVRSKRVRFA